MGVIDGAILPNLRILGEGLAKVIIRGYIVRPGVPGDKFLNRDIAVIGSHRLIFAVSSTRSAHAVSLS
jgi:hypothetical protein